ncbi:MAG: EF-P lysine aminoacylase GenX, partial [Planctomycetaceae bacterium]|nr:EF-P lysine aminoacylase GenX [Planctomycetaceae bacterium]
ACIEPALGSDGPEYLTHYPASQAALAQTCPDDPRTARRFELYIDGIELCNGYLELTDPTELSQRDAAQNRRRESEQNPTLPGAQNMLQAMKYGLPPCAGVALGFDRLVMAATGMASIHDVIPFPFDRA